jgi:major membrane immunogen (membrane-anchored lipoprotein)
MVPRKTAHGLVTWEDLTITLKDGRVVTGSYGYSDRYVTVKTERGSKMTQIADSNPENLAMIMLRELADEGKA